LAGTKTDEKLLEFILDKNSLVPIVEIAFPRSDTCSIVAFRTMLGEMKLLLHLPSLITKTCPKGKLVL
jgi:hypothetical protein